jgi:hypothetical protein
MLEIFTFVQTSVPDPLRFDTDPDPDPALYLSDFKDAN